ncbi:MAG: hypothetical protein IKC32_04630 [Clostridia bacterium]|nr:hypothetical protein [Clostridia bacterium]
MQRIIAGYNGAELPMLLLADFYMDVEEPITRVGFLGIKRTVLSSVRRRYFLVFIPFSYRAKELALIPASDARMPDGERMGGKDSDGRILSVGEFISPFTKEAPYTAEYRITDFFGYDFVYENKSFIADVRNCCTEEALELIYQLYPELASLGLIDG